MTTKQLAASASQYAKRMQRDTKLALTIPEEWDFRAISDAELESAIRYEYRREDASFLKAACDWLDSKVNGKTVRELLLNGDDKSVEKSCPFDLIASIFLGDYPLFPLPWLAFEHDDRIAIAELNSNFRSHAVTVIPFNHRRQLRALKPGCGLHFLCVDFTRAKIKDMIVDFEKWARHEAKKHKRKTGMASAPQWHQLKELAAFRLARAGLEFGAYESGPAYDFVRNAQKIPSGIPHLVLPNYKAPSAWHSAKANARKRIFKQITYAYSV